MRTADQAAPPATCAWKLLAQAAPDLVHHVLDRQPLLGERSAIGYSPCVVLCRFAVDRQAERRADLILPPITPADGRLLIEVAGDARVFEIAINGQRRFRHALL